MQRWLDVIFALPRGSLILDWAGPAEAFRIANQEAEDAARLGEPHAEPQAADALLLRLRFAAPQAQALSSVGAWLSQLEPLPEPLPEPCWVIVVGKAGTGQARADEAEDRAVTAWLARQRPGRPGARLVTVCSGALLAAQAGLLDGRRVTTHHLDLALLQARAPQAHVMANRVLVPDGDVWSSAGVTAGIDLALHLVAEQFGPVVAARTAQRMAVALRRGPDDPQLSPFLAHRDHLDARLHRVQDANSRAPREAWDAASMAAVVRTTPRTLNRLFMAHARTTPLAYLRSIRVALARSALAAGHSVGDAAEMAGFSSDLQLRRAWAATGEAGQPSRHATLLTHSRS